MICSCQGYIEDECELGGYHGLRDVCAEPLRPRRQVPGGKLGDGLHLPLPEGISDWFVMVSTRNSKFSAFLGTNLQFIYFCRYSWFIQ